MIKVKDICFALNSAFPFDSALPFDNVGLLVGSSNKEVKKVLIALEVTNKVIDEAKEFGADLIFTHHPVIFHEMKKVTDDSYTGQLVIKLIKNDLAVISVHTNFDKADYGNNYTLASLFGARNAVDLEDGFAKEFALKEEMFFDEFVEYVKNTLQDTTVRSIGEGRVENVITACGAGISENLILHAKETGSVIVTADVKYNYAQMCKDLGVRVVETTHYASEWCACNKLQCFLEECFESIIVTISQENINPYNENFTWEKE